MRDLARFLENPLDDDGFSLDELIAFSTEHLQRMIADNPGALFNARITATTTVWQVVENCMTDDQTKLGLAQDPKMAKDTFRKALPGNIAKMHAAVVAHYGANASEVVECFPQGRSAFDRCIDDQVENYLQTLLDGLTAHQADLGPQVVGNASGLLSSWMAMYAANESRSGAKTTTEEGKGRISFSCRRGATAEERQSRASFIRR